MAQQSLNADGVTRAQTVQLPHQQMESLLMTAAFGEIVGILMRAPKYKLMKLDALRFSVLPAITHNQYLIARARQSETSAPVAGGVAMWASVSDAVDQRLRSNKEPRLTLSTDEWNSGPHLWLVDLISPSQLAIPILKDLEEKVAKGRPMTAQTVSSDNVVEVTTVKRLLEGLTKEPA